MLKKQFKSYAKINLFLKIVGIRENYHELFSRFIKVKSLYDEMSFEKNIKGEFYINSNFNFPQEQNIIFKTYHSLLLNINNSQKKDVKNFFQNYSIKVKKRIPLMAGLGGGSSNSATFLNMIDEVLNLELNMNKKINIVKNLGSDIIFFLHDFDSANLYGTGEIVEEFKENNQLNIDVFTPKIECHTGKIYQNFRKKFMNISDINELNHLKNTQSKDIFKDININFANDLYKPAKDLCPKLQIYEKKGYLFSGSGSSFFKIDV